MKKCSVCLELVDTSDFYDQKRRDGSVVKMSFCKLCHKDKEKLRRESLAPADRERYYEKMRARQLLRKYGITLEQYDILLEEQGGVCALCGQPETAFEATTREGIQPKLKRLAVDHDHDTGEVRGLLCLLCNTRLGYFEKHGLIGLLFDYLKMGMNL